MEKALLPKAWKRLRRLRASRRRNFGRLGPVITVFPEELLGHGYHLLGLRSWCPAYRGPSPFSASY